MSDSEYTDSEYEEDDDDYVDSIIYEPEEQSLTRYNITICELYNARIHGTENTEALQHYLVYSRYKKLDIELLNDDVIYLQNQYATLPDKSHNIFRNYYEIILNNNYIKPEITECIYLNTGHCVAIKKTIWLKLIQRTWKNILKKRENIIKIRGHPNSLRCKEITGKWPKNCYNFPTIRGMLSILKN
jgi:hypothetical protein